MTRSPTLPARTPADPARRKAPRLVVGLDPGDLAAAVAAHFRALGWDVVPAAGPAEVGRLACRGRVTAAVLPVAGDESGLLVCAKVAAARPAARVVLVGPACPRLARFAGWAGAAGYLPADADPAAVAEAVLGV